MGFAIVGWLCNGPPVRSFLGVWTWLAFAAISMVGFVLSLVLFLLTAPFDPTRRITGRAIRFTGRMMCAATPAWQFRVLAPLPAELPEHLVCISNHASNIDPFLIAHLPWEMKYLAKSVLFRIPFVGWGIGIAGDIPLVRGSTTSIKRAMARAGYYIERGMPVLIFPEGTRSRTGELLPFKDGAFRLAIDKQASLLPIAVAGTVNALPKGDWRPGIARGVVLAGTPISTTGLSLTDLDGLKAECRAAITELRAELARRGHV